MLVKCPQCQTTYKVSDEILRGVAPAFRCSRCKHTFDLEAQEPAEDQELSFAFARTAETAAAKEDAGSFADTAARGKTRSAEGKEHLDRWSMSDSEAKNERPSDVHASENTEKIIDAPENRRPEAAQFPSTSSQHETGDNILSLDPYRDQQASIMPYLTLFGLLVLFYSFVAVFNHAHPTATESVVRQIPLVGSSVLKNNHLKNGVLLQSIRADYQSIQGNREVFVITGVALNQNPVKIREVRLAGQTYNQEGKEIEQQTVWIGNAISAKIVRGMTAQDISDLQRLPPLKTFDIPPGDSVPFTIVFLKSAKGIKDFRCAVIAAQGEVA
jgi:predicted Zn finger-like uncharacterized protein